MVRSIPPRTSTGQRALRSIDPVRYRTRAAHFRNAEFEHPTWGVKPLDRSELAEDVDITIPPRKPLYCTECGGGAFVSARPADCESGWEVDCPHCGQWQTAREEG